MAPKLMTLLLASYHFDNAESFWEIVYDLDRIRVGRVVYKWKPLLPQLVQEFPALKDILTIDARILDV